MTDKFIESFRQEVAKILKEENAFDKHYKDIYADALHFDDTTDLKYTDLTKAYSEAAGNVNAALSMFKAAMESITGSNGFGDNNSSQLKRMYDNLVNAKNAFGSFDMNSYEMGKN